jgi:flagellar motor switch protein FliM
MPEILTQKDIDALLADEGLGVNLAPDVVLWDFAGVPRVPRDRQAVLEAVFARYAQLLESLLSASLRTQVGVSVTSVEQVQAREFLLSLENPCAAALFEAGSAGEGFGVLDFGVGLAFTFLDRLFGGSGEGAAPCRPLTAIEQTVLRTLTERVLGMLREAWQGRIQIGGRVTSFESDPGMIQYADREDGVVVATLEVRADSLQSSFVLGLPVSALESCAQDPLHEAAARTQGRDRPAIEAALRQARVTMSVRLPALRLSMREVKSLAPGQVIHTGLPTDTPVELHVNDEPRFQGSLGQVQRHAGLKIVQRTAAPAFGRPVCPRRGRVL